MKFTIKNLQNSARKIPLPGGKSVPIEANGTVIQFYPQGLQSFFNLLPKLGFSVTTEESSQEKKMNLRKYVLESLRPSGINQFSKVNTVSVKKEAPKASVVQVEKSTVPTPPISEENASFEVKPEPVVKTEPTEEISAQKEEQKSEETLTRDEIVEKCRNMKPEQLKDICDKLNIITNSKKIGTLVEKIANSNASDEALIAAYNEAIAK